MMTKEEMQRYMKQVMLDDIGLVGQTRLKNAAVAVVGAGGLGCPVLQYLTAVGVGTIGIIDFDTVDVSNLHRQVLYSEADIGKKKVHAAAGKLALQNPFTTLVQHDVLLDESNADAILGDYQVVVDGCDNFQSRYVVNDACVRLGKPLVYGSILGYEGQLSVFNYRGSKNLRDIFPDPPDPEDVPSCSENGVLGTVPGIIGTLMAQETIRVILEKPNLVNKYLVFNTEAYTFIPISY